MLVTAGLSPSRGRWGTATGNAVMNMIVADMNATAKSVYFKVMDPLDDDAPDDEVVVTTRRAICRVALVAAETAGRFQREAVEHDPMSWMLAPRRLFDGASAIDACLDRDACMRGILVHGLGLGLDVDRASVDVLLADDDDELKDDNAGGPEAHVFRNLFAGASPMHRVANGRRSRHRLYTAVIADGRPHVMIQAFHASYARSSEEIVDRLAEKVGRDIAERADIRVGFHPATPLVLALVPPDLVRLLRQMERRPPPGAGKTFAIDIQQTIRS